MLSNIKLLPDSGLPIEEETNRNIEKIAEDARRYLEEWWERDNIEERIRRILFEIVRETINNLLRPSVENQIESRRNHAT
jgi:hypothetical protein